jgi:RNA polymerase sigma factor (sigma-70 family)
VLDVDSALARLEAMDPRLGRVVECRYFAGLGVEETAEALGLSPATVKRDWQTARAWLRRELAGETGS